MIAVLGDLIGRLDLAVAVVGVDDEKVGVVRHARLVASHLADVAAVVVRPLVMREAWMDEVG